MPDPNYWFSPMSEQIVSSLMEEVREAAVKAIDTALATRPHMIGIRVADISISSSGEVYVGVMTTQERYEDHLYEKFYVTANFDQKQSLETCLDQARSKIEEDHPNAKGIRIANSRMESGRTITLFFEGYEPKQ